MVKPTDIWLCGYMKSGNTWLSEIVSLIMADGVVDRVRERPITERVPNIFIVDNDRCNSVWFEGLIDPRITVNHLELKYLPRFEGKEGKMIYIVRNPKDVCVSLYRFQHMTKSRAIDWDEMYGFFLDGHLIIGDWLSHVTDFWLAYGTGNHPSFTAETVANITTHCSLRTMRDNPMANQSDLMTRVGKPGAQFVRKGIIGDWRRHMTDTQSALFDERFGQQLRAIGLPVCDELADAQRCMRDTGRIIV
ncbi:unnamed protein product [Medioppia subpectinata]|uniref:Sulfotransferase domain-containing protein n=1 Tax=Medioppia subpectinata TaxID=1979941 RepID=A0A7R9KSK8_9ACAR|nr:unnamed protein product [Medioppia subpectinata]CAG2109010.1 unnamed protein product [Medioppia subpectinata]